MKAKLKRSNTGNAGNILSQPENNSNSPTASDISGMPTQWQPIGVCFNCLMPSEALQPGGLSPRHIESKLPYGMCGPALRAKANRNE